MRLLRRHLPRRAAAAAAVLALAAPLGASVAAQSFLKNQPARVDVSALPSKDAISPGERFTIEVRVAPHHGIHVYAPGNDDYIAVSLTFDRVGGLTFGAQRFPEGEEYYFAPLNETVKVYSKPFTISQEVTAGRGAPKGGEVKVAGTLRYQACDDKVCFPPQSAPVEARVVFRGRN